MATNSSSSSNPPVRAGPAVSSWVTTAVYVSHATAKNLNLQPGELVRIHQGSSSSSTSSSVLPLQSLVLLLLLDDDVAWGHVAVAPPLQQCLAVAAHQYVKLQPLLQAQQLQQLPGLVLHPLLPAANGNTTAAAAAAAAGAAAGSSSMAALAAGLGDAAAAAAARPGSRSRSEGTTMQTGRTARVSISEIEELPDDPSAGNAAPQQQQQLQRRQQRRWQSEPTSRQQQQQDSFTGLGLLQEEVNRMLVRPLQLLTRLTYSTDKSAAANMSTAQQHAQQARPAAAAAASRGDAAAAASALLQPGVASAAVHAWLKLQLQAVAAATTAAAAAAGDDDAVSTSEAALACCGPMLVHFRLLQQQQQQQQQQQPGDAASMQQQGSVQPQDHLLLLVAHHNRQADTTPSASSSSSSSSSYMLPASLLLGSTSSNTAQQQQQQQLDIHVAGALVYDPAVAAVAQSAAAVQHSAHVSLITRSTSSSSSTSSTPTASSTANHNQPQQQQLGQTPGQTLNPADFPWLNPTLESCLARLNPRLGLQSWRAWQAAELPLPGGVLVVGGSDGGRDWLLQLMGQAAAQQHGAHVLKVGDLCTVSCLFGQVLG
jgi:hypothetical protein